MILVLLEKRGFLERLETLECQEKMECLVHMDSKVSPLIIICTQIKMMVAVKYHDSVMLLREHYLIIVASLQVRKETLESLGSKEELENLETQVKEETWDTQVNIVLSTSACGLKTNKEKKKTY